MLWQGRRESTNVEDRRGIGGRGVAVGGGIGAIVIAAIVYLLGGDPGAILNNQPGAATELTPEQQAGEDKSAKFIKVVLADTEDVWTKLFSQANQAYQQPTLVMFNQSTPSACGHASAATGPFYCPADEKLYLDLSFFNEMEHQLQAGGDFAQAYVIAHEVGHHVQKLMGTTQKLDAMRGRVSEKEMNAMSVKLELQADFYAGVWAHYNNQALQEGDIEEALNAANAIGDDRLQKQSQGYVVPDAFTHGTSQQRMYWFKKGYTTGDLRQGDTFNSHEL
ncbi:KPN_02809 family neutral zinc metallopeptidase [Foetidibacter luteolus]|uniref:KPN_02809 family neutral zinc metallopeptidase n=1 Tax=Foetidibacter luteolus TaxID=2608880 RepID=UPI00129B5C7D|nr:neutral zinc metallopeptidase [Foetidibacter luteolus]